ncbi:DNA polymerase III subunit chi [Rhodobacter sp. TJ_12]|uniref:DNA polymerase III subunit chi n=1 Tax=Rhodobacter sp. TJ_12 TaxID=2029399 RepID=UPI001CBC5914|nr:DNA polymerase III subunit chi [Rhodobacter sp. TJ_12]MBZ4023431.1 DNA polymerase III subunit chi [Rhodobacter sp. TJ_12]
MPALFYHVTQSPLEAVVETLLTRALGQGWRVELRGVQAERMAWFDQKLWLGPEDGFLPHGLAGGAHDDLQPVLLTTAPRPEGRQAVMSIDGAAVAPDEVVDLERAWILFNGLDPAAVQHAREQWRALTGAGVSAQYWNEEGGHWMKKAES